MSKVKIILLVLGFLLSMVALDFGTGYLGVVKTRTVGKAHQDAQREVFESTQSYVEGKRQAALKYYKEYKTLNIEQQKSFRNIVAHEFANFNEDEYLTGEVLHFIKLCKYD